jgi:hypothetical protein
MYVEVLAMPLLFCQAFQAILGLFQELLPSTSMKAD